MESKNEDELEHIIYEMHDIITNIKYYKQKYEKMYKICYWLEVKMLNCRELFKETEIKAVNQLEQFLKNLIVCSEQMVIMTEDVQRDLQNLQKISISRNNMEMYSAYSDIIKEKFDMIATGNKYFSEMQQDYIEYSEIVNRIINRHSRKSIWNKLKKYIRKKENVSGKDIRINRGYRKN